MIEILDPYNLLVPYNVKTKKKTEYFNQCIRIQGRHLLVRGGKTCS